MTTRLNKGGRSGQFSRAEMRGLRQVFGTYDHTQAFNLQRMFIGRRLKHTAIVSCLKHMFIGRLLRRMFIGRLLKRMFIGRLLKFMVMGRGLDTLTCEVGIKGAKPHQ